MFFQKKKGVLIKWIMKNTNGPRQIQMISTNSCNVRKTYFELKKKIEISLRKTVFKNIDLSLKYLGFDETFGARYKIKIIYYSYKVCT